MPPNPFTPNPSTTHLQTLKSTLRFRYRRTPHIPLRNHFRASTPLDFGTASFHLTIVGLAINYFLEHRSLHRENDVLNRDNAMLRGIISEWVVAGKELRRRLRERGFCDDAYCGECEASTVAVGGSSGSNGVEKDISNGMVMDEGAVAEKETSMLDLD